MKIPGLAPADLNYLRPYFMGEKAGPQRYRYVLWLDVMGAAPKIARNVKTAAIPVMKLHVAALTAVKKNAKTPIDLYPIIDGIYVVSEDLHPLLFFMSDVFRSMAAEFLAVKNWERSIIRGAISYGPVILGRESAAGADILSETSYCQSILLGMPLVQAYEAEKHAPPFGVYIHESARAFAPPNAQPLTSLLFQWWRTDVPAQKVALALLKELDDYFEWCRNHTTAMGYAIDRIDVHQRLAREYLQDVEKTLTKSGRSVAP